MELVQILIAALQAIVRIVSTKLEDGEIIILTLDPSEFTTDEEMKALQVVSAKARILHHIGKGKLRGRFLITQLKTVSPVGPEEHQLGIDINQLINDVHKSVDV